MAKKKRGRHTSLIRELKKSFLWLENLRAVKKIILGRHAACRHSYPPGYIRWQKDTTTGLHLKGYTGDGVQDLFVIIEPLTEVAQIKSSITKRFA